MAKFISRHRLLWTAVSVQLLAVVISFLILYTCTSGGMPVRDFAEAAYWSTIGLLGFMFLGLAFPLTILVIMVMLCLMVSASNWKRLRFLSLIAFLLWGLYWVLLTLEVCAPPPD